MRLPRLEFTRKAGKDYVVVKQHPVVMRPVTDAERQSIGYEEFKQGPAACAGGECIYRIGDNHMTANAVNRVVTAVEQFTTRIEKLADEKAKSLEAVGNDVENKFERLEQGVTAPVKDAMSKIDDMLNRLTNGGPPLDQ